MAQLLPVPDPVTSYWLSQPHEFRRLRSTPELPSECDVAIIGSGMAGITTAYHIYKQMSPPPRVVLLEARELCSGATARNGGHAKVKISNLASQKPKIGADLVNELQAYVEGIILGLKTIVEEEGLECEFELRRSYEVQLDPRDRAWLKAQYESSRKAGEPWTKNIGWAPSGHAEQVTSIRGALSACDVPVCSFWPYKFNTQLLERIVSRYPEHFNVQTMTPVTGVSVDSDGRNVLTTSRGTLRASKVVFATNAYTAGLLPQYQDVIVPYRGMASHIVPKEPIRPHLSHTYNIMFNADQDHDYLNPRPDGGIVVGGGKPQYQEDKASWFNNYDDSKRFSEEVEKYWEGYMQRTFYGWEESEAKADMIWVGVQAATPDSFHHAGRVPGRDNQWVLAGFNGGGMGLILTTAKATAKMVAEDKGFQDVKEEFGLPNIFATSAGRLRHAFPEAK